MGLKCESTSRFFQPGEGSTVYSQCVLAGAPAVSWLHLGVGLEQEDAGGGAAPPDEDNQGGDGGYADQGDDARDA